MGWTPAEERCARCTAQGESDTEELTLAQRRDTGVNDGCLSYWREGRKQPAVGVEACEEVEPRNRGLCPFVCVFGEWEGLCVCVRECD